VSIDIEPHDTQILLVHSLQEKPQLIGTSRHITGAYSILDLRWDDKKNTLSGSSETVPGDTYSLFIYIPEEVSISRVSSTTISNIEIPVISELTGNLLKLSFTGQSETVRWKVQFNPILR